MANAATLQLAAAAPNFYLLETMSTDVPWRSEISTEELTMEGGALVIPDRPGWALTFDEAAIARHPTNRPRCAHYRGTLVDIPPATRRPITFDPPKNNAKTV